MIDLRARLKNVFGSSSSLKSPVRIGAVGTVAVVGLDGEEVDPLLRREEEQLVLQHPTGMGPPSE